MTTGYLHNAHVLLIVTIKVPVVHYVKKS